MHMVRVTLNDLKRIRIFWEIKVTLNIMIGQQFCINKLLENSGICILKYLI